MQQVLVDSVQLWASVWGLASAGVPGQCLANSLISPVLLIPSSTCNRKTGEKKTTSKMDPRHTLCVQGE